VGIHRTGDRFTLHPHGALFAPAHGRLLVADLHLGKAAHLRKGGLPLPEGNDRATLERLAGVLDLFRPAELVILGDLFHSDLNSSWQVFADWRRSRTERMLLVPGNHARLSVSRYANAGLEVQEPELRMDCLLLCHDPLADEPPEGLHRIGGHLHPGIMLHGTGHQRILLPCFIVGPSATVLPPFGLRQGLLRMRPGRLHRVYACTPTSVLDVTGISPPLGSRTR